MNLDSIFRKIIKDIANESIDGLMDKIYDKVNEKYTIDSYNKTIISNSGMSKIILKLSEEEALNIGSNFGYRWDEDSNAYLHNVDVKQEIINDIVEDAINEYKIEDY